MKLHKNTLRKLIRRIILEKKGGTHTFHGNLWPADKVGLPGPQFDDEVAVTDEDLRDAETYLAEYDPDKLVVYSRGSAVFNKLASENPDMEFPEVTYIAPAAKRDRWGTKNIPTPKVKGRAIASSGDGAVPLKQVCKIGAEAGIPVYVVPGKFKPDKDYEEEGKRNHIRVLKYKNDVAPGKQIDVNACLASELPDWGKGIADKETLELQQRIADELTERLVRDWIHKILMEKEVKCPLKNGKRDYKCEYQKYGGASKKGKKDRAARNQARKVAEREGRVKKGDGKEIDHKKPLSKGGSNAKSNQRIVSRSTNRKKGNK